MSAVPEKPYIGRWWHTLEDGRLQCDLCPRDCRLHEGQRGACFVRMREHDKMVLTTYGRSSVFASTRWKKNRSTISIPVRASCPSAPRAAISPASSARTGHFQVARRGYVGRCGKPGAARTSRARLRVPQRRLHLQRPSDLRRVRDGRCRRVPRGRVKAVAVTAAICTIGRGASSMPRWTRQRRPESLHRGFYFRTCSAHLKEVLDTLVYLEHEPKSGSRSPRCSSRRNDGDEEIDAECRWIAKELGLDVPLHFTAFHPDYKMTDIPPTPAATLTRARKIALGHGLRYVYTGNVHDPRAGRPTARAAAAR